MKCDCYLLEYTELSDTFSSVLVRGDGLLVMLAAGINKYQSFPHLKMFGTLCKIYMCLWLVPHFLPPLVKTFQHKAVEKKHTSCTCSVNSNRKQTSHSEILQWFINSLKKEINQNSNSSTISNALLRYQIFQVIMHSMESDSMHFMEFNNKNYFQF